MRKPLLVVIICSVVFISTSKQVKYSDKFFKVKDATFQSWSPGAVQPNSKNQGGIIYQVNATILKSSQLKFDSLFVDGNVLPLEVVKGADRNYTGSFSKGDQISILARMENGQGKKTASAELMAGISNSKKKGQAFISYWMKNKRYVFPVSEFKSVSNQSRNQ